MKERVLLGMSGGIDSSVAAILLQEQGYEVVGISFRFWDNSEINSFEEVKEISKELGIKHIVSDARDIFKDSIVRYFINEYMQGRTPFPCAMCNNEIKWKLISQEADKLNCSKIAMGHYAGIVFENNSYYIREALDKDKDQSFFLWGLKQDILSRIIFPMADFNKSDIRQIASNKGFKALSKKKDSLGICFGTGDYRDFLREHAPDFDKQVVEGNFIDENGNILGKHKGYPLYTIGQRRGLGIHLNRAVFVKELRTNTNEVVLAPLSSLYKNKFYIKDYNLIDKSQFSNDFDCITRIRYRKQNTLSKIVIIDDKRLCIELAEPLESIAPGQTAVFYRNGKVLGGGFIE